MGAEQFGRLNMWAMLRALLDNDVAIFPLNAAPVSGASGSFNSKAGKGTLLIDFTSGALYQNTGTKASPTWKLVGGGGSSNAFKFTATLSPAIVAANTSAEQLFTVTGIAVGDVVYVNKPTAQAGLGIVGFRVSAANQVGITFGNFTAAGITPTAAESYSFGVIRP